MRIILSPAKQMISNTDILDSSGLPVFLDQAEEILSYLRGLSYEEAKRLWACSDRLARKNYEELARADLRQGLTPAILSYDGIAFKYMAPAVFEYGQFDYVQEHLRILSAFSTGSSAPAAARGATWSSAKANTSAPASRSPSSASLQLDSLWG